MTFDELWAEIEKLHILPEAAIEQVPQILSNETKKRLSRKTPEEVGRILKEAIDEINRGSIETVEGKGDVYPVRGTYADCWRLPICR